MRYSWKRLRENSRRHIPSSRTTIGSALSRSCLVTLTDIVGAVSIDLVIMYWSPADRPPLRLSNRIGILSKDETRKTRVRRSGKVTGNFEHFARRAQTAISPFELSGEGKGQALVLRYAGCNLRCPLCYAWRQAWLPQSSGRRHDVGQSIEALDNLGNEVKGKIVWIRLQGGEPCLSHDRTLTTITLAAGALRAVHEQGLNHFDNTRAVIQTNGIAFSSMTDEQTNRVTDDIGRLLRTVVNGRIIFELSFKSANQQDILKRQLAGFEVLVDRIISPLWRGGLDNVAVYPIGGLGPSIDFHNVWLVPIESASLPDEVPLFHRSSWSPDFENTITNFFGDIVPNHRAYRYYRENPMTRNGMRMAVEELEPTLFQTSWISGYAGGYVQGHMSVTPISRLLRRTKDTCDPQWHALFRRNDGWLGVLNQIPVSNRADQLLDEIRNMRDYLYPSHPMGHYPYL